MNQVFLSIGTNMGERAANLQEAVRLLMQHKGVTVQAVSSIYETAAVGFTEQADFLNIAVYMETTLSADETLQLCQSIENELGRIREFRWGPRIIDLDILLFNHENIETEHLTVPHPRMYERAFVLVPVGELTQFAPTITAKTIALLASVDKEKEGVVLWKKIDTVDEFVRFES